MARRHGKWKGLEPYQCADGKTRWRVRIALPDGSIKRFPGFHNTIEDATRERDRLRTELYAGLSVHLREQELAARRMLTEELAYRLIGEGAKRNKNNETIFNKWWKQFFADEGLVLLVQLKPEHIVKAQQKLLKRGISGARVNRYTDWLRGVLNVAIRQRRYFFPNPVLAVDRFHEDKDPAPFHYSLAIEQKIMAQLSEEEADMVRFGILSGWSQGQQFPLRWEQVFLDANPSYVKLGRRKQSSGRVYVLGKEETAILRRQRQRHPAAHFVWPGRYKDTHRDARVFLRQRFRPACVKAGVPVQHVEKLWHALRHTTGSRMAMLGYREHAIMAKVGWTSARAAQRYIHMFDEQLMEASEKLSGLRLDDSYLTVPKAPKTTPGNPKKSSKARKVAV